MLQLADTKSKSLWRTRAIVEYAIETVDSLLGLFNALVRQRGQGTTKNVEQDLLRAMVVFAGAGLDATLKQIIKDALPEILAKSLTARENFDKFVVRHLCRAGEDAAGVSDPLPSLRKMALLLASESPRAVLIEELVEEMTSHSLQSGAELMRAVALLGISPEFRLNATLIEAFDVRNQIVHEMDLNFAGAVGKRNRRQRSRDSITQYAHALLQSSSRILEQVDRVLTR